METKTKTRFYVPVLPDEEPESPRTEDKQHQIFDVWCLVLFLATAAIAIGTIGNYFGMFTSPSERLTARNAELSEQLATSQAEANRIRECVR